MKSFIFFLSISFGLILFLFCNQVNANKISLIDWYTYKLKNQIEQITNSEEGELIHFKNAQHGHQISKKTLSPNAKKIDLSSFRDILGINKKENTIIVEGGCNMEELIDECLKHNLIPKVLPEFKRITVGGAIVGSALESSSYKYGQFNDICKQIYVLTGDYNVLEVSKENNKDLFYGLSGSYGSLARILAAEIECIPIKSHVITEVKIFHHLDEGLQFMKDMATKYKDEIDFLEGIQFQLPQKGSSTREMTQVIAVISSTLIDKTYLSEKTPIFHVDHTNEEFYYERIQSFAQDHVNSLDILDKDASSTRSFAMPIKPFLFRFDRGAFWMAKPIDFSLSMMKESPLTLPLFFMTWNTPINRWLFRYWFTTKNLYDLLHLAPSDVIAEKMLIMDVYTPWEKTKYLIDFVRDQIPITTPLWLCPVLRPEENITQPLSPHGVHHPGLMIDVGIYGRVLGRKGLDYTRALDLWAIQHNARKMLYSQHTYSKDEFWNFELPQKENITDPVDHVNVLNELDNISQNPLENQETPSNIEEIVEDLNMNNNKISSETMISYHFYQTLRMKYHAEGKFVDLYDKVIGQQTSTCSYSLDSQVCKNENRLTWWEKIQRWLMHLAI